MDLDLRRNVAESFHNELAANEELTMHMDQVRANHE
jgi:hypothetical protein